MVTSPNFRNVQNDLFSFHIFVVASVYSCGLNFMAPIPTDDISITSQLIRRFYTYKCTAISFRPCHSDVKTSFWQLWKLLTIFCGVGVQRAGHGRRGNGVGSNSIRRITFYELKILQNYPLFENLWRTFNLTSHMLKPETHMS